MASVSTSLQMFDAFSKPMRNITQALNITISAMHQLNNATVQNEQVTRSLNEAQRRLASAEADLRNAADQATNAQRRMNQQLQNGRRDADQMSSSVGSLADQVKGLLAMYLGFEAAQRFTGLTLGGAMEKQQYLDTFIARAGNEALGNAIYGQITKQALKFGQKVDQAMSSANSFMSISMDPKHLTSLNKLAMRLSKLNPAEGLEGAAFSMKELMSGDYVSLVERFNIGRSIIKDSDALKAAKAGDVDAFINGFDKLLNQQNMTEKAFEKMLDSPAAKWQKLLGNLKHQFSEAGKGALAAFAPLIDRMNAFFESDSAASFFAGLQRGLYVVVQVAGALFDSLQSVFNTIISNWSVVEPILIAIAVTYLPVIISLVVHLSIRIYQMAAALLVVEWPILLIVLAIAAVVGALNYMGMSTSEIIGHVIGWFLTLFAVIWNTVAAIYNIFAALSEFLINVFIDPVYAIEKLFYDLAMIFLQTSYTMTRGAEEFAGNFMKTVLGAVNKILEGFNWLTDALNEIPGFNIPKVQMFDTNNIHAISDTAKRLMDALKKPTSDQDVVSVNRAPNWHLPDAYGIGKELVDKFKMPDIPGFDPNAKFNIPKVDRVGEVGKIGDTVDISSEDLKVMRELAEMQSIQNFVTLTPTVQVQTGDINNGYDVDTIIKRIEETLEEQIATSAAGVYGHE